MSGLTLNALIEAKGIKKRRIAEILGIQPFSLSRKLTGRRRFTQGEAEELARILNTDIDIIRSAAPMPVRKEKA